MGYYPHASPTLLKAIMEILNENEIVLKKILESAGVKHHA